MIRKAIVEDIDDIISIHREVLSLRWAYSRKYIQETIDSGNCYVIDSIEYDAIIGVIHYYPMRKYLWVNTIAIGKRWQGKGWGTLAMLFLEKEAVRLGYGQLKLWTKCFKYFEGVGYIRFGSVDGGWQGMKKVVKCS